MQSGRRYRRVGLMGFVGRRVRGVRRRARRVAVSSVAIWLVGAGVLSVGAAFAVHAAHEGRASVHHALTADGGVVGRSTAVVVAAGRGWTSRGVDEPRPRAGSCRYRAAADGEQLPDPPYTPDTVTPAVTAGNLGSTVCRRVGYTASVRPPERDTKQRISGSWPPMAWSQARHYELNHLIELSAGGASDIDRRCCICS